jgi:hypothetical protein
LAQHLPLSEAPDKNNPLEDPAAAVFRVQEGEGILYLAFFQRRPVMPPGLAGWLLLLIAVPAAYGMDPFDTERRVSPAPNLKCPK